MGGGSWGSWGRGQDWAGAYRPGLGKFIPPPRPAPLRVLCPFIYFFIHLLQKDLLMDAIRATAAFLNLVRVLGLVCLFVAVAARCAGCLSLSVSPPSPPLSLSQPPLRLSLPRSLAPSFPPPPIPAHTHSPPKGTPAMTAARHFSWAGGTSMSPTTPRRLHLRGRRP